MPLEYAFISRMIQEYLLVEVIRSVTSYKDHMACRAG